MSSSDDDVTTTLEVVLVEEGTTTAEDRQRLKQQIRDEFLQSAVTGDVTKVPAMSPLTATTEICFSLSALWL